jgi:diguanylate cyclase (GGDEF)-like protein/PAS domain S-box-containing protein
VTGNPPSPRTPSYEYSIHEAADKLGVPVHRLRRWHQQGILVARRTEGGHRRYARELIDSLASAGVTALSDSLSAELASVKQSLEDKRRVIHLLIESEQRYRDLVETSQDLIWSTDANGRFVYVNKAAREIFGLAPSEMLGRCFFDFEAPPSQIGNRRFLATLRRNREVRNHITHLRTIQGDDRWIGINARMTADEGGTITGIRGTARDVTESHLALQALERLATSDSLTGLPNRSALQQALEKALAADDIGALLLLDLDHFRYVNDSFGYPAGDQMLVGIASVLREVATETRGRLYRLSADEFGLLIPGALRAQATQAADASLEAVRRYRLAVRTRRRVWSVTASIGIALFPFHGNDVPGLLSSADIAMFQAKELGRNRHVLFDRDPENKRGVQRRIHWARKLRDAIEDDRFVLHRQPVVRLTDRRTMHHEVLVRLRDDDGSLIAPGQFIELAESLGLIGEIDLRVVEKVLRHVESREEDTLRYFVNLSRVSISDASWVRRFQQMLASSRVRPGQLVFEITETAAMSEVDITMDFIHRLKEMGHRFALDDFGAGFSSFYYLKRFEVDYIKIDGGFIRDLARDNANAIFVRALNDVARGLSKQVIAECVETPEAHALLLEMGAQYGQGFLYRAPHPLDGGPDEEVDGRSISVA